MTLGITLNLAVLGYYKYAGFFVENLNSVAGTSFEMPSIVLPLAISFLALHQIRWVTVAG